MPIPQTRGELLALVEGQSSKLFEALDAAPGEVLERSDPEDGLSVRDLLAVRLWWTEALSTWIQAGRRGESPSLPAPGFTWRETPALNARTVRASKAKAPTLRRRLERAHEQVLELVAERSERELLEVGVFAWAERWPVARWVSVNTATQYETLRKWLRRAYDG